MLLNLNPPPMPTPEGARSAQAPAPVDDDPMTADLFAQLVAAATIAKSPLVAARGEAPPPGNAADKPDAARTDAAAIDAAILLTAMPIALPIVLAAGSSEAQHMQFASADAPTRAATPRLARAAPRLTQIDAARDPKSDKAIAREDAEPVATRAALRDQLAAALAPRSGAASLQPAPGTPPAHDLQAQDTGDTGTAKPPPAPAAPSIVAALAAAVERDRLPVRASHEASSSIDATIGASAPPPASAGRHASAPAALTIDTPVGAPGFAQEVAAKVVHVVLRNERAELRVSPPDLGPVEIRIDMKSDSASLTIVAAHPATRDALAQALPHLRESLAAQGIALGQTAIHDGRADSDRRFADGRVASPRGAAADDTEPVIAATRLYLSDRLVDTFA